MNRTTTIRDDHAAKTRLVKLVCIHNPAQTCSRRVQGGSEPTAVQNDEQPSGPEIRGPETPAPGTIGGDPP